MLLKMGELAKRTGLTVRTLHHYDTIGLLTPSARSDAGYRLYDRADIARLHRLASGIGLATAFSIPAGTSIMPHIVRREQLQAANSLFMGVRQLTMFAGPLLAGLLIAVFGDGGNGA